MSPGFISARQLLLVVASDWTSNGAYLGRYERPGAAAPWVPAGSPLAVSLGRGGLAWGRAFLIPGISPGPIKREGDGCSPAGAFPITALFGVSAPAAGAKLPWLQATPDLKCVDDPDSWHYNRIVDRNSVDRIDWLSCEDMLRTDGRYEVGRQPGKPMGPAEETSGKERSSKTAEKPSIIFRAMDVDKTSSPENVGRPPLAPFEVVLDTNAVLDWLVFGNPSMQPIR